MTLTKTHLLNRVLHMFLYRHFYFLANRDRATKVSEQKRQRGPQGY